MGTDSAENKKHRERTRRTRESRVGRAQRHLWKRLASLLPERIRISNNYSSYGSGEKLLEASLGNEANIPKMPTENLDNPIHWCRWAVQFVQLWIISRPFVSLLFALPGIVVYVAFFAALNANRAASVRRLANSYQTSFLTAAKDQNWELARLLGDALIRMNPNDSVCSYNSGIMEQQAGNNEAAQVLMRDAAINLNSGQAAYWLAGQDGDQQEIASWPAEKRMLHRKWLTMAIRQNPNNLVARVAMSNLHRANGDTLAAYEALLPMAGKDSSVDYVLVMFEKELGRVEAAKERSISLIQVNRGVLADVPELLDLRINTANLLDFVEKQEEADQLLEQGKNYLANKADEERFRSAMSQRYVAKANKVAETDSSPRGLMERLNFLLRAVELDSNGPDVTSAVLEACVEASGSGNPQALVLKEAIVRGISPEAAHFVLGTIALFDGETDMALDHLEIAIEKSPQLPGVLNNLAFALSQRDDADLARALQLANAAVKTSDGNLYVLETRGQIFLKMGRWKEAISDLESALAESALRGPVRQSLAVAYDELGQPELAARHRELLSKGL